MPTTPGSQPQVQPENRNGRSVSLDDAASLLGVSRRTIYNRIRNGRLRTIRTLGGSQRVLLDSMNQGTAQPIDRSAISSERAEMPNGSRQRPVTQPA